MRRRATLTIRVVYDDVENDKELEDQLHAAANHLANVGLLSGDGSATVDTWSATVKVEPLRLAEGAKGQ